VSVIPKKNERSYLDIQLYMSEKIDTEGLCGSFDSNPDNDVKHRRTGQTAGAVLTYSTNSLGTIINATVANSWRYVCM